MEPITIKINEIEYIRKDQLQPKITGNVKIVVLQRGWVAIGRHTMNGDECRLDNAHIIRVWGTKNGLGELALNGKTSTTILDKCPPIKYHRLTEIMTIDCVEEKWQNLI